jgi:hypothetical protein
MQTGVWRPLDPLTLQLEHGFRLGDDDLRGRPGIEIIRSPAITKQRGPQPETQGLRIKKIPW